MKAATEFVSRLARGPRASALLVRFGINPRQYWLLMDVFDQLSERGQILDQLGRNALALKTATWLYAALSALLGFFLVLGRCPPGKYMAISLVLTLVLMLSVLVSEAANTIVNPGEAMALAHQPINGPTYTGAKLSHLARIVLYLVPALTVIPALFGEVLPGARWWFALLHLAIGLALGFTVALASCAVFGWLIRFWPVRRIKGTAEVLAALPLVGLMTWQHVASFVQNFRVVPDDPAVRMALALTSIAVALLFIGGGLRSLSGDYLIRVSRLVRGGRSLAAKSRRSWGGWVVHRYFGGQPARAGFVFTSRMMLRDYQFRRQALPALLPVLIGFAAPIASAPHGDPFLPSFTVFHLFPHVLGIIVFFLCLFLPYGDHHQGRWVFLLAPSGALAGVASGVSALLWLRFVVTPNLLALVPLAILWGPGHAILFVAFSICAGSVYVALALPVIESIPFTRQADPKRGATMMGILVLGTVCIALAVAVQWAIVFRSPMIASAVTVACGATAYVLVRRSVRSLESSMRFHLALTTHEAGALYTEIEA